MTSTTTMTSAPARPDTSPRPIPFGRLLRVEWRKATDTRAARWLLFTTAAVSALILLAPALAKNSIDQNYESYLGFPAFVITTLLPVVTILTLTAEWSQRTVLTTFTQEPRRARVITAKVLVAGIMAVAAMVFAALATGIAIAATNSSGRDIVDNLGAANTVGFVLFVLANVMIGVAFGALLHNTATSIVLFFVLPIAFSILGEAAHSVGDWINPSTTFNWLLGGELGDGHVVRIITTALLWVAIPLTAGLIRTARREIQ